MDNIIEVKHLNKTFNKLKAVNDFNFEVKKASCFGLLGPNGAGKTTTMSILYGVVTHDRSPETDLSIFGFNPDKKSLEIKSLSGIVPQNDNLDMELNVFQNLYIYSKFYGIKKSEAVSRIDELLNFMELSDRKKASVRSLSGGMKRRLTIARALLNNPKLLILDEPTTGLDPQVRHLIWNKLRKLKEKGVTILLTTHYMDEAYQICDKIIIMDKGQKIMEGNPKTLLKENLEDFVMEVPNHVLCNTKIDKYVDEYNLRRDDHKETCFVYSDNIEDLKTIGDNLNSEEYHIRVANLEDLFLKVTGRSLNAAQ